MSSTFDALMPRLLTFVPDSVSMSTFVQQKKTPIAIATAAICCCLAYDNITKPPKRLRHIKHTSFFDYLYGFFKDRELSLASQSKQSLYLSFDWTAWVVHVTRPENARKLLMKTDIFQKQDMQIVGQSTLLGRFAFGPNILILNGDKWKAQRMIANPAFHRSLPVSLFGQLTQELFCTMDTMLDSPIDFHDLMERWALDAIGRAGFDFDFHAISKPNNEWVDRYGNIMKAMMEIRYVIFPILERFFLPLLPKRRQIHKELDVFLDMLQSIIDKKRQDLSGVDLSGMNHSEKDLLTLMLEASAEGNGRMTDEEIKSNLCIFFAAGHDTTANSLSYMAYYLARHPDIQQKAREEAIKVLGNESTDILPTKDQLRNMPYINQIIKETLRINSPVAGLIGRVAAQDTDLDGVFIPKGTRVMCSLYELHHNPSVWKNPEEFNPDRFAPNGEAEKLAGIGFAWLPFSNGSRQCIGMNFSMTEQRVLLSMLLRKYELLLPEDSIHKDRIVTRGFFIVSPVDMKINCKKLY